MENGGKRDKEDEDGEGTKKKQYQGYAINKGIFEPQSQSLGILKNSLNARGNMKITTNLGNTGGNFPIS